MTLPPSIRGPILLASLLGVITLLSAGCSSNESAPSAPEKGTAETAPSTPEKGAAAAAGAADGLCEVTADSWEACKDKKVRLEGGNPPRGPSQHPIMTGPSLEGPAKEHQGYLQVGDRQVVVLSAKPMACGGQMVVTGTLEYFELGGEPGTKGSYANWVVRGAEITCK